MNLGDLGNRVDAITLSAEEYRRLLIAAEADDTLIWCEHCGAWIDHDDPAAAHLEDSDSCWRYATRRKQDERLCRSHRAPDSVMRIPPP